MEDEILLSNGELLQIKINFMTLYLIRKEKVDKATQRLKFKETRLKGMKSKNSKEYRDLNEKINDQQMDIAAQMIYVILKSNKKNITFEDALMLCPADTSQIQKLIDSFAKQWETVRCFYEDHSASTQPPRRLPRAGGRAADELFAAACGVARCFSLVRQ